MTNPDDATEVGYKARDAYDVKHQYDESVAQQTRRETATLKNDVGKAALYILCVISLLGALAGFSAALFSSRAQNSTEETTRVLSAVENIASDAICRSEYTGALNSSRVYLDDLTAQITYAGLGIGLPAIVSNPDGQPLPQKALDAIEMVNEASAKVPGARGAVAFYDKQNKELLASQADRDKFDALCERGPLKSPS